MERTYKVLKLLIWVLLFAVIMVGAYVLYNNLSARMEMPGLAAQSGAEETRPEAIPAPDFTVYDIDGNPHKLSDFRGKPILLNFWASWCGPCKREMPEFQNFYEKYGEEVHFVIVNLTDGARETVESASAHIAKEGYTFPVYYDTGLEGAYTYGVNSVPVSCFIDAQGNFMGGVKGALTSDMLQQGMDLLLG